MRKRGILTRLIKRLVTPQKEENEINYRERNRGDGRLHQINKVN